jgi:hypothetical protein
MSTTPMLDATSTSTSAVPTPALRRYRLAVLLLLVALTAAIAATIYLSVRPSSATDSATTPAAPGTSQVDPCFRQAVPC